MRLLLVDDEPLNLTALEAFLEPLGHEIVKAHNGREALLAFERKPPDLIMLDLMMPGFDGIQVLTRVRAHPTRGDTPVILLTAHSDREHRLRGLEAGADEFLEKPIDCSLLLARTKTLLRLKESRDELAASRDALAERNGQLERAQREQQELTEFIVHDLKSPLTGIVANTEWVYEQLRSGDGSMLRALEDVLASSGRLRLMINDLIAVSQLERGTFPIERRSVVLGAMLKTVTKDFRRAAAQKEISLVEPPELTVACQVDPGLMQRVLENILDNSLRYTPRAGRVAVRAAMREELEIAVANSGPPIPVPDRERIFEKFRRGSNVASSAGNAGLGLYFCRRAVEAHGGHIDVVETDEYPTCFRIRLPAA
jgi:two-component system, sensor histidine kinase and response regulator